ncbi:11626_t:CDS:2, partial [Acaulospora colombiana]
MKYPLLSLALATLSMMIFQADAIVDTSPPVRPGSGSWAFAPNSGVSAMHMVQSGPTKMLIIDKAERNIYAIRKNGLYGLSVEYDLTATTNPAYRVLDLSTNTFCSAGSYLGLPDGRVFILGGSTAATSISTKAIQNPTYEFYPNKKETQSRPFDFLLKAFPYNLYPHACVLPYGTQLFLFSGNHAAIWDYARETYVKNIPNIKGPPRTYPLTSTSLLLPLTYENNYKPEFLVCGGGTKFGNTKATADNTCGRIDLSVRNPTWDYDTFVIPRVMGDPVILPNGKVLIVN